MRQFDVHPGVVPTWPGITPAGEVVAAFLACVRVTGDTAAARELMAPVVPAHQVLAEGEQVVERSPEQYAAHVRDMLAAFGRFDYTVTAFLAEDDHVYVRWRQVGRHLAEIDGRAPTGRPLVEVGSAVYRVEDGRIAEYWIQLDRLGISLQLER